MKQPRSILITGASSGIGAALARAYAAPGVSLALVARDAERLAATAAACRGRGAEAVTAILDVTDAAAMAAWIEAHDRTAPIDLAIANAGVSGGTGGDIEPEERTRHIFAVNVAGMLNTVLPLVAPMRRRRHGQIALMSSLASFRGFPGAPAYCASKAAVRVYGEALRGALHGDGVGVSVLCPGFVESPMTAVNKFPMPMLMSAERAAGIIRRGLARNRPRIAFPFPMYMLVWALGALPAMLTDPLFRRLPAKGATR